SGRVLQIMGQLLRDQLVQTSGEVEGVVPYASYSPATGALSIFMINKRTNPRTIALDVEGIAAGASCVRYDLKGHGPSDMNPSWGPICAVTSGSTSSFELSPYSLSAFELV